MKQEMNGLRVDAMNFAFSEKAPLFFKDVSFVCLAGKIHFLQGKNGSGKSTLFKILQGNSDEHAQLTGTFILDGQVEHVRNNQLSDCYVQQVKTVVQQVDEMIAGQFTVEQNLQCAHLAQYPGLRRLPPTKELVVMRQFGIDKTKRADELSGGQRQILAILMALQRPAKLLLLDEPTAALDPQNARIVIQCLQELAEQLNITILIISHDKELVMSYAAGSYLEIKQDDDGVRTIERVEIAKRP